MNRSRSSWTTPALFFSVLLLMIFACESKMVDPAGTLEKKAERYWTERMVKGNFQYTYKEELKEGLPPFAKYEKYISGVTRFDVSSVVVEKVKIEGDQGTVTYRVTCRLPGIPKELDIPMGDRWIIKGNQWKHFLDMETK